MYAHEYCPACYMHLGTSLTSCACGWRMLDPMPRQDLELPPAEHERVVAEARRAALEEAAQCCEREADKCDDAARWGGSRRYTQDCKAAAYALRDRAAAIRAMKEERDG